MHRRPAVLLAGYSILSLLAIAGCSDLTVQEDTPTPDGSPTLTSVPLSCDTSNESCGPNTCNPGEGSPTMLPGANCMSCHSPGNLDDFQKTTSALAPTAPGENLFFTIAGTAFEDLEGSGPLSGATIRVTDSAGKVVTLTTNSAGNFYSATSVSPPLTAQIEVGSDIRKMAHTVDTGACNSCHVCDGTPGGKLHGP